jgi:hypothetical protein
LTLADLGARFPLPTAIRERLQSLIEAGPDAEETVIEVFLAVLADRTKVAGLSSQAQALVDLRHRWLGDRAHRALRRRICSAGLA